MPRKSGLGRGLSALIPEAPPAGVASAFEAGTHLEAARVDADLEGASPGTIHGTTEVPIERVVPNPQQPRTRFDPDQLAELVESVRTHGIIQPLLVSELPHAGPGGVSLYQLIAGERRLRAAQQAGLERVPVTVRQSTPLELLELAIVENVQRADLNPLEEALAYERLAVEFGLTQREIAERVGRSRAAVSNTMRLVDLSEELRASLARGEISEGHARALLGIDDHDERRKAWRRVVDQGLNVRQTEQLVRLWSRPQPERPLVPPQPVFPDPELDALADAVRRSLGAKVTLNRTNTGSGQLTLHFFSDEELDTILDRLLGADRPALG
ncbi:MAG: ParB/RepB/Spo0J family partition protein [Dehalococcoidia bacterium]|nr:ParB/RepB/Spo0J family partition protein [Dehalococcoidia bacterium]